MIIISLNGTTVPGLLLPSVPVWTGPSITIIWVQALLYASLACSLFAALAAVMGKQWLNHYGSVGEQGNVEERGLKRQHKLTGLEVWHVRAVLEFIPFLLQISLLLFGLGLSAFIFSQNHIVAAILIVLNGLGAILYFTIIDMSLNFPDCPYYTPLSTLQGRLSSLAESKPRSWCTRLLIRSLGYFSPTSLVLLLSHFLWRVWIFLSNGTHPHNNGYFPGDAEGGAVDDGPLAHEGVQAVELYRAFQTSSKVDSELLQKDQDTLAAVVWLRKTSTDPIAFTATMSMLPLVHIPSDEVIQSIDVGSLDQLLDHLHSYFEPDPAIPGAFSFIGTNEDLAIGLSSAFLFLYWEKLVIRSDWVVEWAKKLDHKFSRDSSFNRALSRYSIGSASELSKLFDLLRDTLQHAVSLKASGPPMILPTRHHIPPSLEALRIRTAHYLAQSTFLNVDFRSRNLKLWYNQVQSLYRIHRNIKGVSSKDASQVAMIASTVTVTGVVGISR